jgi:two-component system chemotaxis response regulator CheY
MKAKILLVDDSSLARRSVRQMLESAGYEVVEAEDGLVALERYFLEKPDLVLLDLVMRGMMGLDVLQKLRQMDPDVRAIVVSADIQDSSREMAASGGARDFLNKPVDRGALLKAITTTLGEAGPLGEKA